MNDTLPQPLADALDYPLVGPVALIVLGLAIVLAGAWAWDRFTARELDRHRAHAKVYEYERATRRADLDARLREIADEPLADDARVQAWGNEPREVRK